MNKAADGGITALHMAALNGLFDCVQLLLDLEANVSAVTFHYGTSMDMIGISISLSIHHSPKNDLNIIFKFFSQDDDDLVVLLLISFFRSRKHSFALCRLWWES